MGLIGRLRPFVHIARALVIGGAALAASHCGLDVTGSLAPDASTSSSGGSSSTSSGSASSSGSTSSSTSSGDVNVDLDGGVDGRTDAPSDGGSPPDASGATITLSLEAAPDALNITTEGTLDWSYWGESPLGIARKANVTRLIDPYALSGDGWIMGTGMTQMQWPMATSWTDGNGPTVAVNTHGHLVLTGSDNVKVTFPVKAATEERTFSLYLGVGAVNARATANFDDNSAQDFLDFDAAAGPFRRLVVKHRAGTAGRTLYVSYGVLSRKNGGAGASIRFAAATLR